MSLANIFAETFFTGLNERFLNPKLSVGLRVESRPYYRNLDLNRCCALRNCSRYFTNVVKCTYCPY